MENHGKSWKIMENHLFMDDSPRFPIQRLDFLAAPASIFGPKDGISLRQCHWVCDVRSPSPFLSRLVKASLSFLISSCQNIWVCLKMVSTPLYPMVLLIIIPFLNGYFIGVYTIFRHTHFWDATVVNPFLTWPLRPASGGPRQPCGEFKPQKTVLVQLTSNDVECCLPWTGRKRGLRFYRPKWQPSAKFHAF